MCSCCACVFRYFSHVQPCDLMDGSPPDSSVQGTLQSRILEWVAMPSSRESFQPRGQTRVSRFRALAGRFLTTSHTWEAILHAAAAKSLQSCPTLCGPIDGSPPGSPIPGTPIFLGFPCGSAGKESARNAGDPGSIPGLGRSPGEGKGYPLQYSGLENSMDCSPWGPKELEMTEQLTSLHFTSLVKS